MRGSIHRVRSWYFFYISTVYDTQRRRKKIATCPEIWRNRDLNVAFQRFNSGKMSQARTNTKTQRMHRNKYSAVIYLSFFYQELWLLNASVTHRAFGFKSAFWSLTYRSHCWPKSIKNNNNKKFDDWKLSVLYLKNPQLCNLRQLSFLKMRLVFMSYKNFVIDEFR